MRGWTEPLADSVPKGALTPEGNLPSDKLFSEASPVYRLTDAGWNVIHRTHEWVVVTCVASLIGLFATVFGLVTSLK
jgi:hypothetical protein